MGRRMLSFPLSLPIDVGRRWVVSSSSSSLLPPRVRQGCRGGGAQARRPTSPLRLLPTPGREAASFVSLRVLNVSSGRAYAMEHATSTTVFRMQGIANGTALSHASVQLCVAVSTVVPCLRPYGLHFGVVLWCDALCCRALFFALCCAECSARCLVVSARHRHCDVWLCCLGALLGRPLACDLYLGTCTQVVHVPSHLLDRLRALLGTMFMCTTLALLRVPGTSGCAHLCCTR